MFNIPKHLQQISGAKHTHLIFKSAKSKVGLPVRVNWHQLTYGLQIASHKVLNHKNDAALFSPWSPKDGQSGRTKDCPESTALLVFDLDKVDCMDPQVISDWCAPYANFVHTTYSHGVAEKGCFRIYIPLNQSIPIKDYQKNHEFVLNSLPNIKSRIDLSSSDIARCFFMPSCPSETKSLAKYVMCFSGIYAPTIYEDLTSNLSNIINELLPPPAANQGSRNTNLASYAGKAYANGMTPQNFIYEAMRWGSNCQPPMEPNEIHSVINSMWQTHIRNNSAPILSKNIPAKFLRSADEIKNDPPLEWIVRGILPSNGIGAIYGAPSSGKTFLALDLAIAIARGNHWFGNPTIKKSVAYVALEGSHGIRQRILAWEKSNSTAAPKILNFVTTSVSVEDEFAWKTLSNEIFTTLGSGAVVFIDTLNRASPTADENTSASMGRIIESAKYMAGVIGGFVMFVHHAGKDAGKGLRGHSSLLAALDTVIRVNCTNNQRTWSIEKSKDSEIGICNAFELKTIELGSKDIWGIPHTSCTVTQGILKPLSKPISGKHQQKVMAVIAEMLLNEPLKKIALTDLEKNVAGRLETGDPKRVNERAKTAVASLVESGHLIVTNGYITPS